MRSHDSLETEEEKKALLLQKLLNEVDPTNPALIKRDTKEPFLDAQVYPGMLNDQFPLQQRRGNIIQTSLDMDWESSSEFFNSGNRGSSHQESFSGCIPQISVKEDRDVAKIDKKENCSAGHLDHRDHTYACISEGKARSGIKQEKGQVESSLETASKPSSWWSPLSGIPPVVIFLGQAWISESESLFLFKCFLIDFQVDKKATNHIQNQLIDQDYYQVIDSHQNYPRLSS